MAYLVCDALIRNSIPMTNISLNNQLNILCFGNTFRIDMVIIIITIIENENQIG